MIERRDEPLIDQAPSTGPVARGWRSLRQHVDLFAAVSAVPPAVLTFTLLIDLLLGHPHLQPGPTVAWFALFAALAAVPIAAGRRYPRWAGLVVIGVIVCWSGYFASLTHHAHTLVNANLQLPLLGLYLGWFWRPWTARLTLTGSAVVLTVSGLSANVEEATSFSVRITIITALLMAVFCLESASYVRRQAERQAGTDPLTGALNRYGFSRRGPRLLSAAAKRGWPVTLAVLDLDDFKEVNDRDGHAAGDAALCDSVENWNASLGPRDLLVRVGGDEFVLVLLAPLEEAEEELRRSRERAVHGWSWGATEARPDDSIGTLMARADAALYEAKQRK